MSISPLERAGAALQEEVHGQWRDWTRYLQAHLTLLDARAAERHVIFERDATLEEKVRAARSALATMPQARRSLFDQLREERRQAVQGAREVAASREGDGRPLDPDAVERQALQALLLEAEGAGDTSGWGVVPIREGASVTWYEVNVATLRAAPNAATYALGAPEGGSMRTRYVLAGLLVAGGVLFLLVWLLWPRGTTGRGNDAPPPALANGVALAPWPVVGLAVTAPGRDTITLSVIRHQGQATADTAGSRVAIWYPEHLAPLRLCLPADVLAQADELTLLSGEGQPDRRYTLAPEGVSSADLRLEPCSGNAKPRVATLQEIHTLTDANLDETRSLANGTNVVLTDAQIIGPGDDPTLPTGQARVTLSAETTITDWAAYAPTLLLAGGQELLPAEPPGREGNVTTLRYLIPLPTVDTAIVWSLTPPETGRPVRWRTTLATPPARPAVVRDALTVTNVVPELRDSTLNLTITVRNARRLPFVLTPADFQLTRGSTTEPLALAIPEPAVLAAPLAPGATRTLVLTAPIRGALTDSLLLTVGAARFRLTRAG